MPRPTRTDRKARKAQAPAGTWFPLCGALLLLPGCRLLRTPEKVVTAIVPGEKSAHRDPVDLQVQVQRFADDYGAQNAAAIDAYAQRVGTEPARRQGLRWKLTAAAAALSIASGPQPKANLLDLVSLAVLNRAAVEELSRTGADREAWQPWLDTSRVLETNAWTLAADHLPPAQVTELRAAIDQWEARNPEVRNLFAVRPQEFAAMAQGLNALLASANQSVPQLERLSHQAGADRQRVVDRAFRLGLLLIGIGLVGALLTTLAYRVLAARLRPSGVSPSRTPPAPGMS